MFHTPDEDLAACAATLVRALPGRSAKGAALETATANVRCIDCRHFERSGAHPRLGRCLGGERASAAGGWWDTQRRDCGSFVPIRRA